MDGEQRITRLRERRTYKNILSQDSLYDMGTMQKFVDDTVTF